MLYSIIVPAYNEDKIIRKNVIEIYDFLFKNLSVKDFEIIIANDGSDDQTLKISEALGKENKNIRVVSNALNEGRGSILGKAFMVSKGEICAYIDSDLSINLDLFWSLVSEIASGSDIAIGSKHLKNSQVDSPLLRKIISKGYSIILQALFHSDIKDCQCGFKAFRKDLIMRILPQIKQKGWFWDTEILLKAKWSGYIIAELPAKVKLLRERKSKVSPLSDIISMGINLVKLKFESGKYQKLILSHAK